MEGPGHGHQPVGPLQRRLKETLAAAVKGYRLGVVVAAEQSRWPQTTSANGWR